MSDESRRKLLKFIVMGSGAVISDKSLHELWWTSKTLVAQMDGFRTSSISCSLI